MFLKGKEVAEAIYLELQSKMRDSSMIQPGLAFILVGEDPGSIAY
ncbi:MAG: bifunctional 5,10-methylene-tetrahydrofolate dehydrogenase/5,10-methylene-tetrahydrofolate cyclohydrolase, partial [Chlamydiales bacterium]|nr:bifunctional 5,10-methylene-tetrahydrofolate dehydrogenase/5,10-methylene-tetrahydrofolate cyclohydrolase [Chlamydiales bacterium]